MWIVERLQLSYLAEQAYPYTIGEKRQAPFDKSREFILGSRLANDPNQPTRQNVLPGGSAPQFPSRVVLPYLNGLTSMA